MEIFLIAIVYDIVFQITMERFFYLLAMTQPTKTKRKSNPLLSLEQLFNSDTDFAQAVQQSQFSDPKMERWCLSYLGCKDYIH